MSGITYPPDMLPRAEPGDEVEVIVVNDRDEIIERCARVAEARANRASDCEYLGNMDPETGVVDCELETRGGTCICVERRLEAEGIAAAIRALKDEPQ